MLRATSMTTVVSRRLMSTSTTTGGPRLHKAKDAWEALKAARPHDEHPHNVFHPPYNPVVIGGLIASVFAIGYGSMFFGMYHQQTKQGYWK